MSKKYSLKLEEGQAAIGLALTFALSQTAFDAINAVQQKIEKGEGGRGRRSAGDGKASSP